MTTATLPIPIFQGAYVDPVGDFRTSYPLNLQPVAKKTGIDNVYLRTTEGATLFGTLPGRERGGIEWNGVLYRAAGSKLVAISAAGVPNVLGDIGDDGFDAVFTFSFDRLAIASNGILWYWQPPGSTNPGLTQVTDVDIGVVKWVLWIAGYFAVTDGNTIAVTELNDPYSVNPLKYGSAEASPDKIQMLLRINNNLVAVGSLTVEFFQNIGGNLFPFQRLPSALIERGAVSPWAVALYNQTFAFVGRGINETLAVYMAAPGSSVKISTADIEAALQEAGGVAALSSMHIESRVDKGMQLLYVHLPTKTLVYDIEATSLLQMPIWFTVASGTDGASAYRCRNFIRVYDKWVFGDIVSNQTGYLDNTKPTQFAARVPWQFDTMFAYNGGKGAIIHTLELVHNPGSAGSPAQYTVQSSDDGRTFSMPDPAGADDPELQGDTSLRTWWNGVAMFDNRVVLRLRGLNDVPDAFAHLNAEVEPLGV